MDYLVAIEYRFYKNFLCNKTRRLCSCFC